MRSARCTLKSCVLLILFLGFSSAGRPQTTSGPGTAAFGNIPLGLERNVGQTNGDVQFLSRGQGYTLFLTSTEAVFVLNPTNFQPLVRTAGFAGNRLNLQEMLKQRKLAIPPAVVRMKLVGANLTPNAAGVGKLPGTVNYFIGKDPTKWRSNVPTYSRVQYTGVYPNVDLVYYGNQRQLEYDFVVAPGGDPRKVAFGFEGADNLSVDPSGDLVMSTKVGQLRLKKPAIYQMENGSRKPIDGGFEPRTPNTIGLTIKSYDRTKPLVIDPVLTYST
jgi:hypothetical protein